MSLEVSLNNAEGRESIGKPYFSGLHRVNIAFNTPDKPVDGTPQAYR